MNYSILLVMADDTTTLITDKGDEVKAFCPVIISASRSTDIPALYPEWFIHRLEKGYIRWINSFNPHLPYYVSFEKCKAIVFWSKNPAPLIPYLDHLDRGGFFYYFQFTLNDYEKEGFEQGLPSLDERIGTFIRLSSLVGKERVIWRFDPVLLTRTLSVDELLKRIEKIGNRIHEYTEKLVFSFIEMKYAKVKRQADIHGFRGPGAEEKIAFARGIIRLNEKWGLTLASCADETDYFPDIIHNKCIDDLLLRRIGADDDAFTRYLESNARKDPGQRPACQCIRSKDVGQYDTCIHGCVYCYAADHEKAKGNYYRHQKFPDGDTITGEKPVFGKKVNTDIQNYLS